MVDKSCPRCLIGVVRNGVCLNFGCSYGLELEDIPIVVGLRAQGHIPTVERMLTEGATWDDIGAAIGWHGPTAREWYAREHDPTMIEELADAIVDLPSAPWHYAVNPGARFGFISDGHNIWLAVPNDSFTASIPVADDVSQRIARAVVLFHNHADRLLQLARKGVEKS